MLNGSLTVDNNPDAATSTTNVDGSTTTSLPVAGELSGLGRVRGIWNETLDEFGDYEGPDTLILRAAKGAFGVAFNNQNSTPATAKTHAPLTFDHSQKVLGGSGAYARAKKSGTIAVTTNAAQTEVVSLTLQTRNT